MDRAQGAQATRAQTHSDTSTAAPPQMHTRAHAQGQADRLPPQSLPSHSALTLAEPPPDQPGPQCQPALPAGAGPGKVPYLRSPPRGPAPWGTGSPERCQWGLESPPRASIPNGPLQALALGSAAVHGGGREQSQPPAASRTVRGWGSWASRKARPLHEISDPCWTHRVPVRQGEGSYKGEVNVGMCQQGPQGHRWPQPRERREERGEPLPEAQRPPRAFRVFPAALLGAPRCPRVTGTVTGMSVLPRVICTGFRTRPPPLPHCLGGAPRGKQTGVGLGLGPAGPGVRLRQGWWVEGGGRGWLWLVV